jgi:hypothetical protein
MRHFSFSTQLGTRPFQTGETQGAFSGDPIDERGLLLRCADEEEVRMKTTTINRGWRLASRPVGTARKADLEWFEEPLPIVRDGQVLVRSVYLSLDPTNRLWMNEADSYMPAVRLGEIRRSVVLGVVEECRYPALVLVKGDLAGAPSESRSQQVRNRRGPTSDV